MLCYIFVFIFLHIGYKLPRSTYITVSDIKKYESGIGTDELLLTLHLNTFGKRFAEGENKYYVPRGRHSQYLGRRSFTPPARTCAHTRLEHSCLTSHMCAGTRRTAQSNAKWKVQVSESEGWQHLRGSMRVLDSAAGSRDTATKKYTERQSSEMTHTQADPMTSPYPVDSEFKPEFLFL